MGLFLSCEIGVKTGVERQALRTLPSLRVHRGGGDSDGEGSLLLRREGRWEEILIQEGK